MRSLLQFLGTASSVLCAILLTGTLLTATGLADEDLPPDQALSGATCPNCCSCSATDAICARNGVGANCDGYTCRCQCYQSEVTGIYLCRKVNP